MKTKARAVIILLFAILSLLLAVGVGTVRILPGEAVNILCHKLFGATLGDGVSSMLVAVFWDIRLPRAVCAFLVGAALSVSGVVMQSTLQNPLASSYTLGVSSGASLGAALIIVSGFSLPFLGSFTLPLAGFLFGLAAVAVAVALATRLDHSLQNQTVILVGMVFSLFVNAVLTLVSTLYANYLQQLVFWQMGSFSGLGWRNAGILLFVLLLAGLLVLRRSRELDIMTFGDEQSLALGVRTRPVKMELITLGALLTGVSVCFTGTIGFVDLVAPHVARRIFGPKHRLLLPASALMGGAFMALADMIARTVLSPIDLPVGAVTALIGAPFFAYIFFKKRKEARV